jgi:hypothetical protein
MAHPHRMARAGPSKVARKRSAFDCRQCRVDLALIQAGVAVIAPQSNDQLEKHERRDTSRMGGGEKQGGSRRQAHHHGPLFPARVKDGDHVIDIGLDDSRLPGRERR